MALDNPFVEADRLFMGDIYTSNEITENLAVLCDSFRSRFAGTEEEHKAAEFIRAMFEAYGLQNISVESFDYPGWRRGEATLEITSPVRRKIECISLPQCPRSRLEAAVVNLDGGAPADFEKHAGKIKGKIVLVSSERFPKAGRRSVHRQEKYGRSLLNGAAGFVFFNHNPGYGPVTGSIGHQGEALIPGVSISKEDGAFIQRLIRRSGEVTVRLVTTDWSQPATSHNVIGELEGSENPEEVVMLGCHYDGHDIAQGAEDPISGFAAMLEAARVLKLHAGELTRTVRFAAWGAEEVGLVGSRAYADSYADELNRIRFYLNMDCAGAVVNKGISLNEWPDLEPLFEQWAVQMAHPFGIKQSVHAHSDHYPFLTAGVPTGGIESVPPNPAGRGFGHTRHDTLDKVNLQSVREAAGLAARLALRISHESAWPVRHRSQEEVAELFDRPEHRPETELRSAVAKLYQKARAREQT